MPAVDPPLPKGCEHVWLVDADSRTIEGAPSGLVRCGGPVENDAAFYRTAVVACPTLIGDECLCDADCERGQACICASEITTAPGLGQPVGNKCMIADCASADDCRGESCRVDGGDCVGAWFPSALRCTTASDDCIHDSECASPTSSGHCGYDEENELFSCDIGAICE